MINILAVDDDLDFQEILKIKLSATEFKLTLASTESEFFEKFESEKFDVFLLDLSLDNQPLKGLEMVTKIRQGKASDTPIIILTNTDAKKIVANSLELGANDFVNKPLNPQLLISKIKALVSGNQAFEKELEAMPGKGVSLQLGTKMRLVAITEIGFIVEGSAYIAKGSKIKLKSARIKEIFGLESLDVYSTGFNSERSGIYQTVFEIDPDHKDTVSKAKVWIKAHQQEKRSNMS